MAEMTQEEYNNAINNQFRNVEVFPGLSQDPYWQLFQETQAKNSNPVESSAPAVSTTAAPPPPAPSATPPNPWITTSTYQPPKGIKQAQPDIVIDPEIDTSGDYIVERFFEELGGQELINISRHDLIDGQKVTYNPIANLSRLRQRFNPNNIIESDFLSQNQANNATINLISRGMNEPYFDELGQLIVEIDIIRPEENIEVQVANNVTLTRIQT